MFPFEVIPTSWTAAFTFILGITSRVFVAILAAAETVAAVATGFVAADF